MSGLFDKSITVGLMAVMVFAALAHGVVEPWSVLVFELLAALLALLWAIKAVVDKQLRLEIPPLAWPLAGLILLGLVQSFAVTDADGVRQSLSMDVEATRKTLMVLCSLLICCLLAATVFRSRDRLHRLAKFLVLFGAAVGVFGLVQQYAWSGSVYWLRQVETKPFGPFFNRDHFAGFMELLIALPLALIVTRYVRGERRVLYSVAAMMMGIAAIFTLSRGGMIGLAVESVFLAVVGFRRNRLTEGREQGGQLMGVSVVAALVIAIAFGVAWIGAEPVIGRIDPGNPQNFASGRSEIWQDTLAMIGSRPLLGAGLGAYETAYPINALDNGTQGVVAEAHNDYLQILADGGIVGGLLALWFIVVLARSIIRGIGSSDPLLAGLAIGAGAGLLGMLVHSVFDFNLHLPSHALVFLVLSVTVSRVAELATEMSPLRAASPNLAPGFISEVSS